MSLLLTLRPEYRKNASTEVRVAEHTPALRVQLTQHPLHILHSDGMCTEPQGTRQREEGNCRSKERGNRGREQGTKERRNKGRQQESRKYGKIRTRMETSTLIVRVRSLFYDAFSVTKTI
jgi:hypothetical protein